MLPARSRPRLDSEFKTVKDSLQRVIMRLINDRVSTYLILDRDVETCDAKAKAIDPKSVLDTSFIKQLDTTAGSSKDCMSALAQIRSAEEAVWHE